MIPNYQFHSHRSALKSIGESDARIKGDSYLPETYNKVNKFHAISQAFIKSGIFLSQN